MTSTWNQLPETWNSLVNSWHLKLLALRPEISWVETRHLEFLGRNLKRTALDLKFLGWHATPGILSREPETSCPTPEIPWQSTVDTLNS
jgi:hypothetical protein